MSKEIEGIWKKGKIVPLGDINLEEDTIVTISVPEKKKNTKALLELAGTWKNDDETYNTFLNVYTNRGRFTLRKWPTA